MDVHLTLFCFFSLCLPCADSCYAAPNFSQYGIAGENFSVSCPLHSSETLKIICKDDCEGENVLIKTQEENAQSGRYSIVNEQRQGINLLTVGITHLTKSDSGLYRCGFGTSLSPPSFIRFQLRVTDALLHETSDAQEKHLSAEPGTSVTVSCSLPLSGGSKYFCRGACGENTLVQTQEEPTHRGRYSIEYDRRSPYRGLLLVTITELNQSDSGQYRCYQDEPKTSFIDFNITVTQATQPSTSRPATIQTFAAFDQPAIIERGIKNRQVPLSNYVPLIVGVSLAVPVVLISAALLVSCRRKSLTGLMTSRSLDGSVDEIMIDQNCSADDPTYQSLNPASGDQNQIYSELTQPK